MLYFYGGGLIFGFGKNLNMDGINFVLRGDVVVVFVNYCVGLFGFLNLNDDVYKGNYVILDMIIVLEWVNKYIKYFGGDLNKVILFGEFVGVLGIYVVFSLLKVKGLFYCVIL